MLSIENQPGLIVLKDNHSVWQTCSDSFKLNCGLKAKSQVRGLTDYDMKCEAVEMADSFIKQDSLVIKTKQPLKVLHFINFLSNKASKLYLAQKSYISRLDINFTEICTMLMDITTPYSIQFSHYLLNLSGSKQRSNQFSHIITESNFQAKLSKKQRECLFYLSLGKTAK